MGEDEVLYRGGKSYYSIESWGTGIQRMFSSCREYGIREPELLEIGDSFRRMTPQDKILVFCEVPRSKNEIVTYLGYKDSRHFTKEFMKPLLETGKLVMTIPDKPNSKNQKYVLNKLKGEHLHSDGFYSYDK
ncbi:hypothetical protein EII17_07390 [Clostridiales bacterium COT073_COT-073]|nr:hypothetical protein EII17_07390 [Clostridiales bacterium COT073_COT-073]